MEMEIICTSFDDEMDLQKKNKKTKSNNTALTCEKIKTLSSEDEKVEGINNLKRKILKTDAEVQTQSGMKKKKKLDIDRNTFVAIKVQPDLSHKLSNKIAYIAQPKNQEKVQSNMKKKKLNTDQDTSVATVTVQPVLNHTSDKLNHTAQPNDQEIIIEPKLVVEEKKKISYIAHDVFPLFISLCLQRSKNTDKKDMKKMVNKLKKCYEELDPAYTSSERFVSFINEKRVAIMNNDKTIYVHIHEVMNEMKKSIKKKSHALPSDETYDAVPSTSYATSNLSTDNAAKSDYNNDDKNTSPKTRHKIKQILHAMIKCEKIIKKLEEAEVDFDKEDDSTYIKVERYKQRMVELHNKYCELTGENADAGCAYLCPKHISPTRIVAVDQAITNFINSKIARRNKMKKTRTLTEDVIFPDYRDILECVTRCNDKRNLGLDRRKQEQLAKKAFIELGEFLQRTRRNDYWDTFSLYLENNEEDPAVKDKDLAQKLNDNRTEGEKRLTAVFAKYTKKQEEIKEQNDIEKSSEEEEEEGEEESVMDDKNKDDVSITNLTEVESDNEDINEKVKDKSLVVKNDVNINTVNINSNTDKGMSNKAILGVSPQKCKTDKVKILMKENIIALKNKNQITGKKIGYKTCNNNTVAKDVIVTDAKTPEDLVPTCSTTACTSNNNKIEEDLPEVIMEDMFTVTADPVIQTVTETADVIAGAIAEPIVEEATEIIADDETEVIAENAKDVTVIEIQWDKEIKPLLRVRSFAKVPTTWVEVDNRQKRDKEIKPLLRVRSFAKVPTTWVEVDNRQKRKDLLEQDTKKPKVLSVENANDIMIIKWPPNNTEENWPFQPKNIFDNETLIKRQENTLNCSLLTESLSPIVKTTNMLNLGSSWRLQRPTSTFSGAKYFTQSTPKLKFKNKNNLQMNKENIEISKENMKINNKNIEIDKENMEINKSEREKGRIKKILLKKDNLIKKKLPTCQSSEKVQKVDTIKNVAQAAPAKILLEKINNFLQTKPDNNDDNRQATEQVHVEFVDLEPSNFSELQHLYERKRTVKSMRKKRKRRKRRKKM